MNVAIVHDYLMRVDGAEKVVEALHDLFPKAPVFTSVYQADAMPDSYRDWDIRTTFLQRLTFKKRSRRVPLLLYPTAFESLDLSSFDLVISSSSAFAKGIITGPDTIHICYTHTPMRFAWAPRSELREERISRLAHPFLPLTLHYLRTWDALASMRVDFHIANSRAVSQRIRKFYRRDSEIVAPPVDTARFHISPQIEDYYVMVTRFEPRNRLALAVEACTRLNRPLKIVGSGSYGRKLREIAGPQVEFLGAVSDAALPALLARARAYILPGEEDFDISSVEANASGRPVIAFAAGGALDSQIDGVTGVLFREPSAQSLMDAMQRADSIAFDPQMIRAHAETFDISCFQLAIQRIIESAVGPKVFFDSQTAVEAGDEKVSQQRKQA